MMKFSARKTIAAFSVLCCIFFLSAVKECHAQDMTEVQPLGFGEFAIVDNNAPHQIVVDPDNSVTYDPELVPNTQAQRGIYNFTGLAANVTFYLGVTVPNPPAEGGITLDNPQPLTTGGGQVFTIGSFKINTADELVTDGAGSATMYVGATLTTSGNGSVYADGNYAGQYDITLFY